MMPPAGARRPDRATLDAFSAKIAREIDDAAAAHPNPGSTALHRLNRTEYGNAIRDLLALGATDFMQPPFCVEELRARIEHNLLRPLPVRVAEIPPDYGAPAPTHAGIRIATGPTAETEARLCETILDRSGSELEAYAVALATQRATSRASFRAAKGEVVARFERAYIRAALGRHGGNITLAAQMAQKHRRAFWALMQKHDIDPTPYRVSPSCTPPPGRSG